MQGKDGMGSGKAKTIDIRYRRKRGGVDWDEKCPHLVRSGVDVEVYCIL